MNFARRSARVLEIAVEAPRAPPGPQACGKRDDMNLERNRLKRNCFGEIPFFLISILRIRVSKRQFRNPTNSGCECEPVPWALTEISAFGTCITRQVNGTFICYLCLLKKVTEKYGLKLN